MEQIFMIEVFVEKIILKIEPPEKDEYELRMEEEERRREAEALAALEAAKKGKKGKKGGGGGKKGKKGKQPPPPSEEEIKFLQTCTLQMTCLPLFDFYIAHDNFIAPPPPPPPPKKGKKAKPAKPKKGKKGAVQKIVLPSEPLPEPPYFGVGNAVIFLSRVSKLEETLAKTPMYISVWNRNQDMNCIGYVIVEWHKSFFECLEQASELNPPDLDNGEYRNTRRAEIVTNTIVLKRSLQCEEDLKASGEIEFYIKLSCLGNRIMSYFVSLPEAERLPARKYVSDDLYLKDLEIVRHWEGTLIDDLLPVAYLFGAPDITRDPKCPEEEVVVYDDYVIPYTKSEIEIVTMGYPKMTCSARECIRRRGYGTSKQEEKRKHDKKDTTGPCGKEDCPLGLLGFHPFICDKGMYKTCNKPCVTEDVLLQD
ncbi:unnamed protein product [Arctia plantaginis]|uniref:Uncharacterized protein n=1 Tax=Arctia plantaginis TaxID=874455 RepID=A0A8S1A104_ARCPL|nr:unnamed protein product [Arctia plantaginis]CAB3238189.1 unnamed protein product [Arctia plantaginis]